jgi:hypothetical protein
MISKSAVLVGNDEFWHSAIIDDSCTTSSTDSCDKQLAPSAAGLPTAHHQLLSRDVPSYECLTGYDHRGEDTSASLFFDEDDDDDMLTSDDDDDEDARMAASCCRQEKMSSVKKRGGGSWLLGFARLQSRPVVDEDYCLEEEEEEMDSSSKLSSALEQQDDDNTPPGLVRTDSVSDCTEEDDNSTTTSTSSSISSDDSDNDSPKKKSVGFNSTVKIQPIPHASTYSPIQRRKMYSSSLEVRKNKIRNKKEYRFDGYDWRNVTEEWEMSVDMVTGELVHPVHSHML